MSSTNNNKPWIYAAGVGLALLGVAVVYKALSNTDEESDAQGVEKLRIESDCIQKRLKEKALIPLQRDSNSRIEQ